MRTYVSSRGLNVKPDSPAAKNAAPSEDAMGSKWAVATAVAAVVGLGKTVPTILAELRPATQQSFAAAPADAPEMAWWRASMQTHEQRIQWWRQARFGMFIHWGVYS